MGRVRVIRHQRNRDRFHDHRHDRYNPIYHYVASDDAMPSGVVVVATMVVMDKIVVVSDTWW